MADENVQRLRRLDCCAVSDALDKLKLPGVVGGLPQRSGAGRIAGRAITVKLGPGAPPPGPPVHLGCAAIEAASDENVLVIEQTSGVEAGCWGGLLSLAAKVRGVAGVVADGPVRDIDEAIAYGLPIFSRALTARTARGRIVEKGTNVPVRIGGTGGGVSGGTGDGTNGVAGSDARGETSGTGGGTSRDASGDTSCGTGGIADAGGETGDKTGDGTGSKTSDEDRQANAGAGVGVSVEAGDYVLADNSAVVFIRAADVEAVLAAAETIVAKEAAMAKAILAGTPVSQVMGGHYEHMLR